MAVNEVTVEQLKQAVEAGARVIDVREPDEYHSGHVPNARLVPLAEVPENIDAFQSDQIVYVVCLSGGRSMRACEFLHGVGVSNVVM